MTASSAAAASVAPERAPSVRSSSIEEFRFRNAAPLSPPQGGDAAASRAATATESAAPLRAYSRLYAQGVDLLEHKDSVFRQFGLLKSPRGEPSSVAIAGGSSSPSPKTASAPMLQRTTTSRKIALASGSQSRSNSRSAQPSTRKERSSSAPYVSDRRALPAGVAVARTFSFRSTLESRTLVSPKPKPKTATAVSRRIATAAAASGWSSQRQTGRSASALQAANSALATHAKRSGAHASSAKRTAPHVGALARPSSPARTRSGDRGSGVPPSGPHCTASASTNAFATRRCSSAGTQQQQSRVCSGGDSGSRRESTVKAASAGTAGSSVSTHASSKRQSVRMGVPTTFAGASADAASAPVLIQVSRRTSSPIMTPSVAEFGMRRRPSVSPIPALQPGSDSAGGCAPQPRASVLLRRDSKMERLMEQISVLKATLGLSDEDLQWKVESTKGNAFLAAERHLTDGEERYDRLVYEVQLLSQTPCEEVSASLVKQVRAIIAQTHAIGASKPALAACQSDVARLKKELLDVRITSELQLATAGQPDEVAVPSEDPTPALLAQLEAAKDRILHVQEQLKDDISKLNDMVLVLGSETDRLDKTCAEFRFMSPDVADVSNQLIAILKRIPECGAGEKLLVLCDQAIATATKLRGSRLRDLKQKESDLAKTMADIEVWKTRRDQAKEYPVELAKREQQWRVDHSADNTAALALLRSLVPQDVQQLSVEAIIARAASLGVLFTFDLAIYIKQNRFLHWLVTHASDVARDNFLAIESAPWFTNFVAYDIHELRALAAVLPPPNTVSCAGSFDFDKDGRKAEWRLQFMDHVYALVKRQRGESVKAGWDPVRRTRGDVPLQPLTDKQLLNAVYRYPSEQEIEARIAKYELQRKRLDDKRAKLESLDTELIPAAKAEYLAIADDARSDELQRSFGKATLIAMRDDAKQALQTLTKTRDVLKSETAHSEKQWRALCPTYEQFLDEVAKVRALDPATRAARIRGPFPSELELQPRARAAFKKLSVEEEAQARKLELDHAIASRGKEIGEAATEAALPPAGGVDATGQSGDLVHDPSSSSSSQQPPQRASGLDGASDSDAATCESNVSPSETEDAPAQSRASFRRVKSLQVSTEVLKFLQQDFCSSQRVNRLAASHGSATGGRSAAKAALAVTAAVKIKRFASEQSIDVRGSSSSDADIAPVAPATPVRPKSKALLKLLEKEQASAAAAPASEGDASSSSSTGGGSQDSATATATAAAPAPAGTGRPLAPPMKLTNMFSELQSRFAKKKSSDAPAETRAVASASAAPVSFLDELKRKASQKTQQSTESPTPSSASGSEKSGARPPPAPTSFVAELRARAQSVE